MTTKHIISNRRQNEGKMTHAKIGDKVRVHFTGTLEDGTIFGSTISEEPFEFTIGEKNMLPGFENAVIGMKKGETKTITLAPEDAYGVYNEKMVHAMERSGFPNEINVEIGKRLIALKMEDIPWLPLKTSPKTVSSWMKTIPLQAKPSFLRSNLLKFYRKHIIESL